MTRMYDLAIYDEHENCIFDRANTTTEVIGKNQTGRANGSLTDVNIGNRSVWVKTTKVLSDDYIIVPTSKASYWWRPCFTVSGNTITWTFVRFRFEDPSYGSMPPNFEFIYGVF